MWGIIKQNGLRSFVEVEGMVLFQIRPGSVMSIEKKLGWVWVWSAKKRWHPKPFQAQLRSPHFLIVKLAPAEDIQYMEDDVHILICL